MPLVYSRPTKVTKSKPLVVIKYNPHHDHLGRFTSGGGGGALSSFERKVDEAYGTGEEAFSIAHTGDVSTAALGTYLAKGHVLNDSLRDGPDAAKNDWMTDTRTAEDVAVGLDHAIEVAPRMPNETVWRVASAEAISSLKKGATYQDSGFTSTTAADITQPEHGILLLSLAHVSDGQKTIMQINTGKEGKGLYMPKMFPGQPIAEHEKEFLLPRNTQMKYLGVDYKFIGDSRPLEIHKFKVVN